MRKLTKEACVSAGLGSVCPRCRDIRDAVRHGAIVGGTTATSSLGHSFARAPAADPYWVDAAPAYYCLVGPDWCPGTLFEPLSMYCYRQTQKVLFALHPASTAP